MNGQYSTFFLPSLYLPSFLEVTNLKVHETTGQRVTVQLLGCTSTEADLGGLGWSVPYDLQGQLQVTLMSGGVGNILISSQMDLASWILLTPNGFS